MQPEILRRSGRGHRVPPRRSEPLHRAAIGRIERNPLQIIEHIVEPHRPQAMKKLARVIQHHPRLFSFSDQLRDELAHTLVAPHEHRRVVIVADARIIHHVLQIADDRGGVEIAASRRNERLVHVERDRKRAANPAEIDARLGQVKGAASGHRVGDKVLRSANVWQSFDGFGKGLWTHNPASPSIRSGVN